ncbi:VOC family protein [Devosia salina]|uniref:VOC family protein n=1 Tax=Devosia salina TaxID=2860336 RepID=A0ABX8WDX0_9HYPH|nr:VOC family protein [Devosia salina]QYO76279.1 VOC family protein [Devosia salina]
MQDVNPARFGIILKTEKIAECVKFYQDVLSLKLWYQKPDLFCFHFGADSYLMVERGGVTSGLRKGAETNPVVLRFDVPDVDRAADRIAGLGIDVEVLRFEWGTIAIFSDPDGNPCEFKNADDPYFELQP